MGLIEDISITGLEADLDVSDLNASITLQIDGASHWTTLTIQRDDDIARLRDWLVKYCEAAGID